MGGGWNQPGPTARPPTGAVSVIPAPNLRPDRVKNAYVREDRILTYLPTLHVLLTETDPARGRRRRTRRGTDVRHQASIENVIGYLPEQQITLTYDPAASALRAGTGPTAMTITLKAS